MIDYDAYDCDPRPPIRWRRIALLLAAVAAVLALTGLAHAQEGINRPPVCGTVANLNAEMAKYGEIPTGIGVTTNGGVVELYADPDDGSWTLLERSASRPDAVGVLRVDEGWQGRDSQPGEPS